MSPEPQSVAVRMYQVGFGDCILVSFRYAEALPDGRAERHMLVDFGSTHRPKGSRKGSIVAKAAALIEQDTHGRLDVVVLSHRHRDHLSGFADDDAQKAILRMDPKLVVRPWTEHPGLPRDATAPLPAAGDGASLRFTDRLAAGHQLAARIEELAAGAHASSLAGRLAELARDQVPNPEAIAFLDTLAESTGGGEYLKAGDATTIPDHIPGIGVQVLGPPTIADDPDIQKARQNDPDEFWLVQRNQLAALTPERIDTTRTAPPLDVEPGPVAWIVRRLARQQVGALQRIVRTVDDALNNTSLILVVQAGDRRLLLPGDAQIENWLWALEHSDQVEAYKELLTRVDLYKVGHHGSRNATPKSLFHIWEEQSKDDHPMVALMSTMPDVHGESEATAVPRGSLVEALERRMTLVRTDGIDDRPSVAVEAPCRGEATFAVVADAPPPP